MFFSCCHFVHLWCPWWRRRRQGSEYSIVLPSNESISEEVQCCENIMLENDKTITSLVPRDCLNIHVINCKNITRVPDMQYFNLLEVIKIKHCSIEECTTYFPNCLRTLEITYSCMKEFRPQNIPTTLAQLDLSFNKLKEIPGCIDQLYENNKNMKITLSHNDFWYTMYSDLSPSLICPQTMPELVLANKLNVISLTKLRYCANILAEKKHSKEAEWLAKHVGIRLQIRREEETVNTFHNVQNVHLTSIQGSMKANIQYILSYVPKDSVLDKQRFILLLKDTLQLETVLFNDIQNLLDYKHYHSGYQATYYDVLYKVFYICKESEHKHDLLKILKHEIIDGIRTCLTGQITRLVNTLSGYDPNIKVTISKNEELANSVIAIRKKYALMYPDEEQYIIELTPAVLQMLEDLCIEEPEQVAWLEYI